MCHLHSEKYFVEHFHTFLKLGDTKNVLITFVSARIVKTCWKRLSLEANILAWKFCLCWQNQYGQGQVVWISLSNNIHPGTQLPSLTRGQPCTEPCGHVVLVSQYLWRDTLYERKLRSRGHMVSKWWRYELNTGHYPSQLCASLPKLNFFSWNNYVKRLMR